MFAQGRENSKYETRKSERMAVMLAQYLVHRARAFAQFSRPIKSNINLIQPVVVVAVCLSILVLRSANAKPN